MSQHIHKFRRVDMGRDKPYWVMQCSLPGCSTYIPMKSMLSCPPLKGKISLCNKCGDRFVLNRRALRLSKPICDACVASPKAKKIQTVNELITKLEKDLGITE